MKDVEGESFIHKGAYLSEAYKDYIKTFERIGKFNTDNKEIDVLIVELKDAKYLERARSMQRNFIASYLNGSRGGKQKDAALVAFYATGANDWRFSFVKMDYNIKVSDNNIKIEKEFSSAKRFSFLVGENEKIHTAESRFLPLIISDNKPSFADIEKAFDVEVVSDEFFKKYRDLFIKLKIELDNLYQNDEKINKEFKAKNITTVDFAKKLLGQIIFLYFLQKKGWFGVDKNEPWGSGPKNFIRKLFNKDYISYNNFYNEILEPLFYEALRTDRACNDHFYDKLKCKIPFLNGGLFDPINSYDWVNTEIKIPNEIFSNNDKTKEGDGILDIFDRYNFTVNEEEPLEKEVALDPELLGKIYEKLNAIRDDNFDEYLTALKSGKAGEETKFNKEYGVYYTPREIVHYICQESLINYLYTNLNGKVPKDDIDFLVKNVEISEEYEAIALEKEKKINNGYQKGSEYESKLPESIKIYAKDIDILLSDITVCDPAIGSGAFPIGMLHEIIRLRKLLAVFHNSNMDFYDIKRQCIEKTLYGVDIDAGAIETCKLRFWLSLIVDEDDFSNIRPLPNLDYKIVCGNSLIGINVDLFNNDDLILLSKYEKEFFNETNPINKLGLKKLINDLINRITDGKSVFDFKIYFQEVFLNKGGFDAVIGNPPYIQLQKAYNDTMKYADLYKTMRYETFDRTGDIYCLFYEKGLQIAKDNGLLCYISSNKWMRAGYGEKLRNFFLKYNPLLLLDLGPGIFESATVDTCIMMLQKSKIKDKYFLQAVTITKEKNLPLDIDEQVKGKSVTLSKLTKDAWFIGSEAEQKLKEKIEHIGKPLKDWDVKIYYGIKTGFNEAFIIDNTKRQEILDNCKDEDERRRTEAIIKPILRGRDIKRYYYEWAGLWVIFIPWHFPLHNDASIQGASEKAENEFIKQYPSVYNHLLQYKESLSKRNKEETGIRYEWYALQRCAATYYPEFEKEKVVWAGVGKNLEMCVIEGGKFVNAPANFITIKRTLYFLGLLNSKIINWYNSTIKTNLGDSGSRFYIRDFENIPLPPITATNQPIVEQIEALVDKILAAKKTNHAADTTAWEKEIDQLVYKLYDLTDEEIAIVERRQ